MRRSIAFLALVALAVAGALAACDPDGETAGVSLTLEVTSHQDGQVVADPDVTVAGSLRGGPVTSFSAELGGSDVAGVSYDATNFAVPLTLAPGENTLLLRANSATSTVSRSLSLTFEPEQEPVTDPDPDPDPDPTPDPDADPEPDPDPDPDPDPEPVLLSVTSHVDGERIVGSREVEVRGSLSGGPPTGFSAQLDGVEIDEVAFDDTSFSVSTTLHGGSNLLTFEVEAEAGLEAAALALFYPFLELDDFTPATRVIGQPDFQSAAPGTTATSLSGPYGAPALLDGVLYLPDYSNDRVLGFSGGLPEVDGAAADFALGQADLTSRDRSDAADGLDSPVAVTSGSGRLFVSEWSNSRVSAWDTLPTSMQRPSDFVLGQPGFDSSVSSCGASGMDGVEGVFATDEVLLVADESNNRVLIFTSLPTQNGQRADLALGQDALDECAPNDVNHDGLGDGIVSAETLRRPTDAWTDGTRLVVADAHNHRVLIWSSFPTRNGQPADVVVGQTTMGDAVAEAGADGLNDPWFVDSNGNQLFVADRGNERVLIFDAFPTANGASADRVLGQADFEKRASNDADQDGADDGVPSARTLHDPRGVRALDEGLLVTDGDNNRVLLFVP